MQIRIFQDSEAAQARAYLQSERGDGRCAAAFVYGKPGPELDGDYGALIVAIPHHMGLSYPGQAAIRRRYTILEWLHRERLALRIKDVEIEEAIALIAPAMCGLE